MLHGNFFARLREGVISFQFTLLTLMISTESLTSILEPKSKSKCRSCRGTKAEDEELSKVATEEQAASFRRMSGVMERGVAVLTLTDAPKMD